VYILLGETRFSDDTLFKQRIYRAPYDT